MKSIYTFSELKDMGYEPLPDWIKKEAERHLRFITRNTKYDEFWRKMDGVNDATRNK